MAQRVLVVGLDHLTALGTHHAVITQRQTGGGNDIMADKVMLTILIAAIPIAVRVLAVAVRIAAATAAGTVRRGGQVDIGNAALHHVGVRIGVGDLIIDRVIPSFGIIGGAGQGAGVRAVAVADGGSHARLAQVRHGYGMGRSIRRAVIIRYHSLCGGVFGFGIAAVFAGFHLHKPLVRQLWPDAALHAVPLQDGIGFLVRAVAEAAVFAAGGDDAVIRAVRLLDGFRFGQLLKKVVGAVVQPVHILLVAVVGLCHIGIDIAANLADGFRPVVAGICGVLAGYTV